MSKLGSLYLIPNLLGGDTANEVIPIGIKPLVEKVKLIFVESPKLARKVLIGLGLKDQLANIELISIKKGFDQELRLIASDALKNGEDVGVISDAGLPAIADPGNEIVKIAHGLEATVYPLTGPSSIFLGLMASGFNGQNFAFHGYLPKDPDSRQKKIRELEKLVYSNNQTQIFIETPYRNEYLFKDMLSQCQKNTKICIAMNLTVPEQWIKVDLVENWRKMKIDIRKKQCIFLMYK